MHTALADLQVIPEKEVSCDVLVIGMGFAGPVAAVRAAENGAKVLVIDKQPKNWWTPGGITMIHAELHLAFRTLDQPEDELRRGLLDCTDGAVPRDLLDVTVKNAGRAYRWLTDHGGEFNGIRFHPQGPNRVWGRIKPGGIYDLANTGVKKLTLGLEAQLQQLGGEIRYETKALNFITNGKGEVVGVMARDADGQFKINAKSVILCAGGYGENTDMLVKYLGPRGDEVIRWVGPWQTGDGFKMAEEVDAALRSMNHAAFSHYYSSDAYLKEDLLGAYLDQPAIHGIIVDRDGHRFVDETLGPRIVGPLMSKTSIYKQGWIILDQAARDMPDVKARIDDLLEFGGTLHVADSLDELAKQAGIGPRLRVTVEEFNDAVAAGTTPMLPVPKGNGGYAVGTGWVDGNRALPIATGPFYAVPFVPGIVTTYGGVLVNTDSQVLDWDKRPIPNLYAAGLSMMGSMCGGTENPAGAYVGYQAVCLIFALLAAEAVTRK